MSRKRIFDIIVVDSKTKTKKEKFLQYSSFLLSLRVMSDDDEWGFA